LVPKRLKIAFLHPKGQYYITGRHFDNTFYRFLFEGLPRSDRIDYTTISIDNEPVELGGYDLLFLYCNFVPRQRLPDVPKIAIYGDAHGVKQEWYTGCREQGIKAIVSHQPECYVRKYLPDDFSYENIIFGVDENIYKSPPFGTRRKDKISLTGTTGSRRCYGNKPLRGSAVFYNLRNKCKYDVPFVEYEPFVMTHDPAGGYIGRGAYIGDNFGVLLGRFRAAIAACTKYVVHKYFEMPMCGCLTFMEACEGIEQFGFIDGEHSIFINDDNFVDRMREFIDDPDNPKWAKIAENGRNFVLKHYEQKVQVDKLIDIMEKL